MSNCEFFPSCGGCSFLDLTESEYQQTKKNNLKEVLQKNNFEQNVISNIEYFFVGPKSRRKITLQIDSKNKLGFFAKNTNNIVEITSCYVANPALSDLIIPLKNLVKEFENNLLTQITLCQFDNVVDVIFAVSRDLNFSQMQKIATFAKSFKINVSYAKKNDITTIIITSPNQINFDQYSLALDSNIFIQATKAGLEKIIKLQREYILKNTTKPIIADIYGGFGAYSFALADLAKEIYVFEGDIKMTNLTLKNAKKNGLANKIKAQNRDLILYPISNEELKRFDLVIINPPRNGAGPQIEKIAASKLNKLIYVSCNPQSFARDAKILFNSGFKIKTIASIDQFYSSNHLELVAIFERS